MTWKNGFNLFIATSTIKNGDQKKALFLHMAIKELKEIYRFLNSNHADHTS